VLWLGRWWGFRQGKMGPELWKLTTSVTIATSTPIGIPTAPGAPRGWQRSRSQSAGLRPSLFPPAAPPTGADPVLAYRRCMSAAVAWRFVVRPAPPLRRLLPHTTVLFHGVATREIPAHLRATKPFRHRDHSRNKA